MKTAILCTTVLGAALSLATAAPLPAVNLLRAPDGGIQPQALVDAEGVLHVVYLKGEPKACDVFYARRPAGSTNFATPLRVNSEPGSAIAVGTIRGAQFALGRNGRLHVAWNGSGSPKAGRGAPMLYSRLNDAGTAFEPQRNLMTTTMNLDGGGSVAADPAGNVFVIWHAHPAGEGPKSEQTRAVFMALSADDGKNFAAERRVNPAATGACGCCGLKAFAEPGGGLAVLYRAVGGGLDRDITLLLSADQGRTFRSKVLAPVRLATCPMSSMDLAPGTGGSLLAMWEKDGQVFGTSVSTNSLDFDEPEAPAGKSAGRKHPVIVLASTKEGARRLTAWTEGTGWSKGGSLAWEVTEPGGAKTAGRVPGVPVWGRIAAAAEPNGTFTIVY